MKTIHRPLVLLHVFLSSLIIPLNLVQADGTSPGTSTITITQQPQNQEVALGATATFSVTATSSTQPVTYQWHTRDTAIPGATDATLTVANVGTNNVGTYFVVVTNAQGSISSAPAILSISSSGSSPSPTSKPVITQQPQTQSVQLGASASFSVTVSGAGPFTYQWRFNEANLSGATSPTLTIPQVSTANVGLYVVVVTGSNGAATASLPAGLIIQGGTNSGLPLIISQPLPQLVALGGAATFSVTATGAAPLSYEWIGNGVPITTTNGPTLSIPNVTFANVGGYKVVVTNAAGSVTSAVAPLLLLTSPPATGTSPVITQQPQSQTVAVGGNASFTVAATGDNLQYQWLFNEIPVKGATSATLSLPNVTPANAGGYVVVVFNTGGFVRGNVAGLTVTGGASTLPGNDPQAPIISGSGYSPTSYQNIPFGGNTYDVVLMTGEQLTVKANAGHLTRVAFMDPDYDIVFAEFGGAGQMDVTIPNATLELPPRYNQSLQYARGRASFEISGNDSSTFLSIYTLGSDPTRVNPNLVQNTTAINTGSTSNPGQADIGSITIDGAQMGGLNVLNTVMSGDGAYGIFAPNTTFVNPVYFGTLDPTAAGSLRLFFKDVVQLVIGPSGLTQANGQPVQVSGVSNILVLKQDQTSFGQQSNLISTATAATIKSQIQNYNGTVQVQP